jgi:hypothetical protein
LDLDAQALDLILLVPDQPLRLLGSHGMLGNLFRQRSALGLELRHVGPERCELGGRLCELPLLAVPLELQVSDRHLNLRRLKHEPLQLLFNPLKPLCAELCLLHRRAQQRDVVRAVSVRVPSRHRRRNLLRCEGRLQGHSGWRCVRGLRLGLHR